MSITIGIDVGGTKIAAGVVDESGAVIARKHIATDAADQIAVVAAITKAATELKAAAPAVAAIGVGAAGLVDAENGIVVSAPNIDWSNVHLRAQLTDRLGLPVVVDNDANVAAYGEATHGAGRGAGDQLMVTVGTGIGGGIIIGGRIYHGARGVGAEPGHMIIDASSDAVCACGNHGCFEAMASGNSIGRRARERVGEDGARGVLDKAGGVEQITGELVGEHAVAGDEWARAIVAETGTWLGVGLAGLVNLLDPDVIIIGGGAAAGLGEVLIAPARARMHELMIGHRWRKPPPIIGAALGADSGIIGAAALARGIAARGR